MFNVSRRRFFWDKLIFWGVGLYAVMFLLSRFCLLYGFTEGLLPHLFRLGVLIFILMLAGRQLGFYRATDIVPYAIGWTAIAMILDKIMIFPIEGWDMYSNIQLWVGYALILFVPLMAPHMTHKPEPAEIT